MSSSVLPMFSSKSFIFQGLTFRSLSHFIFVYGVRKCSNLIVLHVAVQFSKHRLLKRLFLPIAYCCLLCQKQGNHRCMGLFLGFLSCSIFLFLCQYHTVLMTVAFQYSLKSGSLIPPAPFFFLKTALAIRGLLCFHMNCEIFCPSSVKNTVGSLIEIALNLQIVLGSILIFTLLIVPIHEHGTLLHLFVSSLISFSSVL